MNPVPIRNASTVIIVRDAKTRPRILMGQRGKDAAFMPDKFVFPGGAVDPSDGSVPLAGQPTQTCMRRLASLADPESVSGLLASVARELWEETGQILGARANETAHWPTDWQGFTRTGYVPTAAGLRFIFRAITPPGRPRRFDARFFLLDAKALVSDLDDFSQASDELSHLHWVALDEARHLNLPFITEVVLAEVAGQLKDGDQSDGVPFFKNDAGHSEFRRIL